MLTLCTIAGDEIHEKTKHHSVPRNAQV